MDLVHDNAIYLTYVCVYVYSLYFLLSCIHTLAKYVASSHIYGVCVGIYIVLNSFIDICCHTVLKVKDLPLSFWTLLLRMQLM